MLFYSVFIWMLFRYNCYVMLVGSLCEIGLATLWIQIADIVAEDGSKLYVI